MVTMSQSLIKDLTTLKASMTKKTLKARFTCGQVWSGPSKIEMSPVGWETGHLSSSVNPLFSFVFTIDRFKYPCRLEIYFRLFSGGGGYPQT